MTSGPDSSVMGKLRRQAMLSLRIRRLLGRPVSDAHSMTWRLNTAQGEVELVLRSCGAEITLECRSSDPLTARSLRAALVSDARLVAEPQEHHVLATFGSEGSGFAKLALRETAAWATTVQGRTARSKQINGGDTSLQHLVAQGIWYDRRPNFGDAVGPWLVASMTGKEIVNVRKTRETPSKARGRATLLVGSIIQMLNRHNVDIWGSGLMRPLSQEQVVAFSRLRKIRVRAVRGTLTAEELRAKLSWDVPEVYGDPALLLPRFLPVQTRGDHITVVPHLKHRSAMTGLRSDRLLVADVREDLETVVAKIASARACISTSLHGIIVAQAYGVPWLWLNVTDSPVDGRDFKFDDFFTTIDSSAVAQTDVPLHDLAGLDFAGLAETAALPELKADLDLLEAALPIRKASQQRQ